MSTTNYTQMLQSISTLFNQVFETERTKIEDIQSADQLSVEIKNTFAAIKSLNEMLQGVQSLLSISSSNFELRATRNPSSASDASASFASETSDNDVLFKLFIDISTAITKFATRNQDLQKRCPEFNLSLIQVFSDNREFLSTAFEKVMQTLISGLVVYDPETKNGLSEIKARYAELLQITAFASTLKYGEKCDANVLKAFKEIMDTMRTDLNVGPIVQFVQMCCVVPTSA